MSLRKFIFKNTNVYSNFLYYSCCKPEIIAKFKVKRKNRKRAKISPELFERLNPPTFSNSKKNQDG